MLCRLWPWVFSVVLIVVGRSPPLLLTALWPCGRCRHRFRVKLAQSDRRTDARGFLEHNQLLPDIHWRYALTQRCRLQALNQSTMNTNTSIAKMTVLAWAS